MACKRLYLPAPNDCNSGLCDYYGYGYGETETVKHIALEWKFNPCPGNGFLQWLPASGGLFPCQAYLQI